MKWVYATAVALLVVVFVFFLHSEDPPEIFPFPATLSDEPDVVIEGLDLTRFDANGTRHYRILAGQARYFETQGHAEISDLNLTLYTADHETWEMSATTGIFNEAAEDPFLDLSGGVALTTKRTNRKPLFVDSNAMRIYPLRKVVESSTTVTVKEGDSNFRAERFEADLSTNRVVFSSSPDEQVELHLQADS